MRVVVLVGSGLSMGAGYPCTKTLTQTVLSGESVFRHTDAAYHLRRPGDPEGQPEIAMVVAFLRRLAKLVTVYPYRRDLPVNYEDLAYVVGQIVDSQSGELDNPALGPLHDALRDDIVGILERWGQEQHKEGRWNSDILAREAFNYIADIAWRLLQAEHVAEYLGPFLQFVRDERLEDVSVFTLNNDTLLERRFRAAGLEFADGFGDRVNDVRYWEPDRLERDSPSRRVVKLHGSVDWFLLRPDDGQFHEERIGQVSGDPWNTHDPDGRPQQPVDDRGGRPLLLVGTHNKARGYLRPPFFDVHIEFYRRLKRAEVLLVIGYGGQDKAVNERIVDWMESDLSHRLVMVNRNARIVDQVRGALRGHERFMTLLGEVPARGIPRWREQERFDLIELPVAQVSAEHYFEAIST